MALSDSQRSKVKELLSSKIEKKLEKYGRETTIMPFLARLIQDNEKIAAYSFIMRSQSQIRTIKLGFI